MALRFLHLEYESKLGNLLPKGMRFASYQAQAPAGEVSIVYMDSALMNS